MEDRKSFSVRWINPSEENLPGVEHHTFHSPSMDREVGYNVYLPLEYSNSDKRYPVIYWLHGAARGGESIGVEHSRILHDAIHAGQLPPMIMVFPCGGRGTLYYDSPDGTIMAETSIIKELVPLVDENYRTIADRAARAIEGFSMGGFGALKLGFKYPGLFCSIVSGAPAIVDWDRASSLPARKNYPPDFPKRMWNDDRDIFESDHVYAWLEKNSEVIRRDLRIRIVVGNEDQLKGFIDRFHSKLEELGVPHDYEVLEGVGHNRVQVYQLAGLRGLHFHAVSFAPGIHQTSR